LLPLIGNYRCFKKLRKNLDNHSVPRFPHLPRCTVKGRLTFFFFISLVLSNDPHYHLSNMAPSKLINLLAFSSLAVLVCLLAVAPANALSIDTSHNVVRRDHVLLAKKKRSTPNKRCKQRAVSSSSITTSSKSTATSAKAAVAAPAPTTSSTKASSPTPSPTSSGGSSGNKIGIAWSSGDDPALADWANGASWYVFFS
jgi:hypothetical protein